MLLTTEENKRERSQVRRKGRSMKKFRIKGSISVINANCLLEATKKLVCEKDEIAEYKPHWYTHSNRKSWAEVKTTYGYECIIEEV